jgi:hypothetical protein
MRQPSQHPSSPDQTAMPASTAIETDSQISEDTRPWSASMDAVPPAIPALDPVAQMLLEERNESSLMRLVLCAALSVALLAVAGGLLS